MTGMAAITVNDRIALVRSVFTPFPDAAGVPHRDRFGRLVDSYGVSRIFEYAFQRGIAHAVLASHEWHPAVLDEAGPFQLFAHICRAIAELHRTELARIAEAFSASGIPLLAYKGIVLDLLLGNPRVPSFSQDIDLLVRRDAVTDARKVLESLGYGAELRIASGHVRREGTQRVKIGDRYVSTLSDQVLSWSLAHRLYVDAMVLQQRSIKSVCHIKLLSRAGRLDVRHVHEVARRFPYLAPSLHYLLRAADVLYGLGIGAAADPAGLHQVTAPTMNLGDCLPVLLDVAVAFELDDTGGTRHGNEHVSVRFC